MNTENGHIPATRIVRVAAPIENLKLNSPLIKRRHIRRVMKIERIGDSNRYRLFFKVDPTETVCTFTLPSNLKGFTISPLKVTAIRFPSSDGKEAMLDIILGVCSGDQD